MVRRHRGTRSHPARTKWVASTSERNTDDIDDEMMVMM
jgi:hypothetical protein